MFILAITSSRKQITLIYISRVIIKERGFSQYLLDTALVLIRVLYFRSRLLISFPPSIETRARTSRPFLYDNEKHAATTWNLDAASDTRQRKKLIMALLVQEYPSSGRY